MGFQEVGGRGLGIAMTEMASTGQPDGGLADLAHMLISRRTQSQPPPWVLLGSGLEISNAQPPGPLADFVAGRGKPEPSFTASAGDLVAAGRDYWDRSPSMGERHLAALVHSGFLRCVLDFGWSNSFERALAQLRPQGSYRKLVRGEHDENYLKRALRFGSSDPCVVKIFGDIVGLSALAAIRQDLSPELVREFQEQFSSTDVIVIGTLPATHEVARLLTGVDAAVWVVGTAPLTGLRNVREIPAHSPDEIASMIRQLGLLIARNQLRDLDRENRKRMNAQVRSKQQIDATYSDRLIQRLAQALREACDDWRDETLLVFVHDPAAPGGSEVEKRIRRYLPVEGRAPDTVQITVRGDTIRWLARHADEITVTDALRGRYVRAVIIDSVSFSGHTLRLATAAVRKSLPTVQILWAALVVSEALVASLDGIGMERDQLLSIFVTDRHDIFFPWGWTQATSSVQRRVPLHGGEHSISVSQRPWGTIESLTYQESSAVRLKTLRAGGRTSYQRHALRDGFFIALDDDLGIEFDSEDGTVVEAAVLARGEYLAIPRGVRYRFCAYRDSVRILELSFGLFDEVHDLERYADDYGRVGKLGDV